MNAEVGDAGARQAPPPPRPTGRPTPDRGVRNRRQPPPDDRPTSVFRFDNDATQKIPTISGDDAPPVDLSDRTTARRVTEESRAQESHAPITPLSATAPAEAAPETDLETSAPLQRTPDLTTALAQRSSPQRHPESAADRRRGIARGAKITGRVLVALACVMALVGTGYVWGAMKVWDGNWRNVDAVNPDDENIRNKDAQYGDETYLIVGTDSRSGQNGKIGAGDATSVEGIRSDTVLLVNVPANRSRVVAVSFPRDLQVDRPTCRSWDSNNRNYGDELSAESSVKLNSVYAFGGPECLVRVLTAMSGLNINHFISMDFNGFAQVVRAIGGVEVCSTVPLYDYELGQILAKAGKKKLNGKRALNYVRARNIASEGNGDYGRIKRQQLFMSSLLRSTLSGNILSSPGRLNSLVNTFIENSIVDNVNTQSLLDLAKSMQGMDAGRVTFLTVPTSGTSQDGQNNEIPRTEDIDAIFNAIIDDEPLPQEHPAKRKKKSSAKPSESPSTPAAPAGPRTVTATAQNPYNVEMRVLNGTSQSGLATQVSESFIANGFEVTGVADASEQRSDTVVRYGPGQEDSAATVAKMIPGASIQPDHTVQSGVEVIIGSNYGGGLDSAPEVGGTLSVTELPASTSPTRLPNDLAVTNAGDTTCS